MRFGIHFWFRIFSLSSWLRVCMEEFRESCAMISNDYFQSLALSLLERDLNKVDFTDEEFLHKKINNKDVYMDYDTTEDISEDTCSLSQYEDLTALD